MNPHYLMMSSVRWWNYYLYTILERSFLCAENNTLLCECINRLCYFRLAGEVKRRAQGRFQRLNELRSV